MRTLWMILVSTALALIIIPTSFATEHDGPLYAERLCGNPEYRCLTAGERAPHHRSDVIPWEELFPDPMERDFIMRLNRRNTSLAPHERIAIPHNYHNYSLKAFSPLPQRITAPGEQLLVWSPPDLAWALYNNDGTQITWGPAVGGKSWCSDVGRPCRTIVGKFRILYRYGRWHRSNLYPRGCKKKDSKKKCAPIPFMMTFHGSGYGFHASYTVPGRHASHGCVRMFFEDAKKVNRMVAAGTRVLILPYQGEQLVALQ